MVFSIFCPQCNTLMLAALVCPACEWQRPPAEVGLGVASWRLELERELARPQCYPLTIGETYYIVTQDGTVLSLDLARHRVIWQRAAETHVTAHGLAGDDERIFVSHQDTRPAPPSQHALLALAAQTGQLCWSYQTSAHSLSMATVSDGRVYCTDSSGHLHAVDACTGQAIWVVKHPVWGPAAPAVGCGIVCTGGRGETLVAYRASDGGEQWRFTADGWFVTQPVIAHQRVYVWNWDGYIYTLDAHSGQLLWKVKGERGQGFTTPPVIVDNRMFIGSRVYRTDNGTRERIYALLALNAADGREIWRNYTEKYISAPIKVAEGIVFCSSDDYIFYAFDATHGSERWRIQSDAPFVTQPQIVGDQVYVADQQGALQALYWHIRVAAQEIDPQRLLNQGAYDEAAAGYALRGDYAEAAAIYTQVPDRLSRAARLYELSGAPAEAARYYEQAGNLQRARELFKTTNDNIGQARVLEQMGELLTAAQVYQEINDWENAARLYEQAGDRTHAATLYEQGGQITRAHAIWQSLGEWERLVKMLLSVGRIREAAEVLEQQSKLERAATLYEQAECLNAALRLRIQLSHWEHAATLAEHMGEDEQVAIAYEHLDQPLRAAEAYERAAHRVLTQPTPNETQAATFLEQAAHHYSKTYNQEQADACRHRVKQYRRLPEVAVEINVHEAFVEFEWNTVKLQVQNIGYGVAHNVRIALQGPFDVRGDFISPTATGQHKYLHFLRNALRGQFHLQHELFDSGATGQHEYLEIQQLQPDNQHVIDVYLRPQHEQRGKVPLQIFVIYDDAHGAAQTLTEISPVYVNRPNDPREHHTPPTIHVRAGRDAEVASGLQRFPLTLRFVSEGDRTQIIWEADAIGRRTSTFQSPFDAESLPLIIKALDAVQWPDHPQGGPKLSQNEQQRLADLHLWANGRVVSDIEQRIGRALYDALIAHTEAQIALHTVRDYATRQGLPVSYVLRFPPQATHLVALPWELLRDQYGPVLLSRGQVGSCVRYLDFDQALPPALPPSDTLRILAIAPNAGIPQAIRSEERAVRKAAWKQLVQSGSVEIEELNPVTPAELVDRFHRGPRVDIIHFYGHGRYTDGSGSLLLDDKDNSHCWVSAERLAALFGNNTRLIVLHACQSSMSSEKGLLTGVAPALSAAGVHAVVAMQLTVRITAATRFAEIVYRNLARGISLQRSVSLARQALFFEESDGASWYVPTLNIRGRDLSPLHLLQGKPSS